MFAMVFLLAGCWDGVKELNEKYCAETNAAKRELLLKAIRLKFSDYPDGGLCTIEDKIKVVIGQR
jgi:hypothetical protein